MPDGILVAVTDHAAERYRQRVGTRTGSVDVKPEIITRVSRAYAAGPTRAARRARRGRRRAPARGAGLAARAGRAAPRAHLRVPPRPRQPRAARRDTVGRGRG